MFRDDGEEWEWREGRETQEGGNIYIFNYD